MKDLSITHPGSETMPLFHVAAGLRPLAVCVLLAGAAMVPASMAQVPTSAATPDQVTQNKEAVIAAFDRWQAGGTDFFTEILADDVVWTIKGSGPTAGTYRGRDDLVARAVRPLASRLSHPIRPVTKQIWAEGDHVIIQWDGEGMARDGKPYANSYLWIFQMAQGRATSVTAFLDLIPYDDVLRRVPAGEG